MSDARTMPLLPRILIHAGVYLLAATMLIPFLWMVSTSLKTDAQSASPPTFSTLLPTDPQWGNYAEALRAAEIDRFYINSLAVAAITTLLAVAHNALAGFAFAKMRFTGKKPLFLITLATMMLPVQVFFIFAYLVARSVGYIDNWQALIVPFLASGFGIFYMRQAIHAVPDSLLEAGRIDGMDDFELFWTIVRPTVWPAIAALGIFTFMNSWNSFFWPLIVIDSIDQKTLPLAIADLASGLYVPSWPVIMAATTILTTPLIIVFFFTQRAFVQGVALTGMKE